jgi:hypothetical protein
MVCLPRRFNATTVLLLREKRYRWTFFLSVSYLSILGPLFLPPFGHGHGNLTLRLEKRSRATKSTNHGQYFNDKALFGFLRPRESENGNKEDFLSVHVTAFALPDKRTQRQINSKV